MATNKPEWYDYTSQHRYDPSFSELQTDSFVLVVTEWKTTGEWLISVSRQGAKQLRHASFIGHETPPMTRQEVKEYALNWVRLWFEKSREEFVFE